MFNFKKDDSDNKTEDTTTKTYKARVIFQEMMKSNTLNKEDMVKRFIDEVKLTEAGALSYFHKFNKEFDYPVKKSPTKMDKAREIYVEMSKNEESRMVIIDEFMKQVGLSKAAASTYYQTIKNKSVKNL